MWTINLPVNHVSSDTFVEADAELVHIALWEKPME